MSLFCRGGTWLQYILREVSTTERPCTVKFDDVARAAGQNKPNHDAIHSINTVCPTRNLESNVKQAHIKQSVSGMLCSSVMQSACADGTVISIAVQSQFGGVVQSIAARSLGKYQVTNSIRRLFNGYRSRGHMHVTGRLSRACKLNEDCTERVGQDRSIPASVGRPFSLSRCSSVQRNAVVRN